MIIYGLDYIKTQFNSLRFSDELGDGVACIGFSEQVLAMNNHKKAVYCDTLSEVLQCNAALCDFIIPNKNILKDSITLAEKYLFDSKILCFVDDIDDINEFAMMGIDCVLVRRFCENLKNYFLK